MKKKIAWSWISILAACMGVVGVCSAASAPSAKAILGLCDGDGARIDGVDANGQAKTDSNVGLSSWLWVVVATTAEAGEKPQIAAGCKELLVTPGASSQPPSSQQAPQVNNPQPATPDASAQPLPSQQTPKPVAQPAPPVELNVADYGLMLGGQEVQGLDEVQYDPLAHAFKFRLTRSDKNETLWRSLLGSPTASHRTVSVALRERDVNGTGQSTIYGTNGSATFSLLVFSWIWFWVAVLAVAVLLALVIGTARQSTTLRDTLLPQLPANEQPFSLGRCQMAFWFVLVFASFIFLYAMLWDYNTVSGQALVLMGIASTTALASVAVDVYKDSPADAANRALQALGIRSPADLVRIGEEIGRRAAQVGDAVTERDEKLAAALAAQAASDHIAKDRHAPAAQKSAAAKAAKAAAALADIADKALKNLHGEIQDRRNILRTYDHTVAPFRSQSFFRDLTTDLNGPTVHRLQVLIWTVALGLVFVVGVYRDLAMPSFSAILLALMGISGAGYVGFKYPEKNN